MDSRGILPEAYIREPDPSWVEEQINDLLTEEDEVSFVRKLMEFRKQMKGENQNV